MPSTSLEQLILWVNEIPPLPAVAVRVMQMTDDPSVGPRDIAHIVSADVALTARVLRIANSAYYGMVRKVSTVNEAVMMLGMKAMRSLAVAAAAYDTLKNELEGYNLPAGELWRHSISCALASQIVAKKTRAAQVEEAFVAGLLHDVGKVVLSLYVTQQFQAIVALVELDGVAFYTAERTVLGYDHAEVGARVAEKWNLPADLCAAIGGHHEPFVQDNSPALSSVVHVANAVCLAEGFGVGVEIGRIPMASEAIQTLGMTIQDVDTIVDELVECLQTSNNLTQLMNAA